MGDVVTLNEINFEETLDLETFDFEGIEIEDLRKYIEEETDFENVFCFFLELFYYCQEESYKFSKSHEISLITFVLQNIDNIFSDVIESDIIKKLLIDIVIFYIVESENVEELVNLFSLLIGKSCLYLFIDSLKNWEIYYHLDKIHLIKGEILFPSV